MTPDLLEVTFARRQPSPRTFRPLDENAERFDSARSDEHPQPSPIELASVPEVASGLWQMSHG
jgi:hypothetical protein